MVYRRGIATQILVAPFWLTGVAVYLLLELVMLLLALPLMLLVSAIGTYNARRDPQRGRNPVRLPRPFDLSKINSWLGHAEALPRISGGNHS